MSDFETRLRAELREVADQIEPTRSLADLRARIERQRPAGPRWRLALRRARAALTTVDKTRHHGAAV